MSGRCGISPAGQPRLTEEARIGLGLPLTLWFGDCSPADARLHQRHRGLDDARLRMTMTRSLRWRTRPRSCEMKMFMLRCAFRSASRFSTCAWIRASSAETRFITDDHGGPWSDRAGDRNALALTAREFKRLDPGTLRIVPPGQGAGRRVHRARLWSTRHWRGYRT